MMLVFIGEAVSTPWVCGFLFRPTFFFMCVCVCVKSFSDVRRARAVVVVVVVHYG